MNARPWPEGDRTPGAGGQSTFSRRAAIGLGAAVLAGAALGAEAGPANAATTEETGLLDSLRPAIAPRSAWGADRPVTGPIVPEEDVRFLLVHHTASTNEYGPNDVADQIRGFHQFHTGQEKGWPDVAYNFFVDRFGGLWEARQGSIDGAVRGDATGGSQGFALLCSLIGDHSKVPVSDEARTSLVALLAWLAERHGIVTDPGTTVDFVSRGSNRWPVGAEVTTASLSGHRDMSQTTCPGDFAYDLLAVDLPTAVSERRRLVAASVGSTSTTTAPPPTLVTPEPAPAATAEPDEATDGAADPEDAAAGPGQDREGGSDDLDRLIGPAAVAGVVAAGGLAATRMAKRGDRRGPADDRP